MGDRSGSREPKGASLKKSKKNPGASAAKAKKASLKALGLQSGPVTSLPPPAVSNDIEGGIFDCGVALLSRQFDRDRDRVLQRAQQEGKSLGMLIWFSDIEKQSQIADFCKSNAGVCYYATGIHPDNIDRTNKKSHDDWLKQVEELGRKSECISILTGLNLSREIGTHFSQESLLKSSLEIAERIILPTTFHIPDIKSLERVFEILESEFLEAPEDSLIIPGGDPVFIIHDIVTCSAAEERILAHPAMQHPRIYYSVSGAGITDPDAAVSMRAKQFIASLARDRLLVCSDSPWRTPQNLSDPYLRTLRNEPANLPAVVQAVSECLGISLENTTTLLAENSFRAFNLTRASDVNALAVAAATAASSKASASSATSLDHSMQDLSLQPSIPPAPVAVAVAAPTGGDIPAASASATTAEAVYRCVKCRQLLFRGKDVTTHQLSAVKTVFKVGEEGLCSSFHFVPAAEGRDIHKRLGVSIRGGNVECSECGVKLGKFSTGDAVCPCGAVVHGPVAKVNATKIDSHLHGDVLSHGDEGETNTMTKQLAERSRLEAEDSQRQALVEAQEEELRNALSQGRVRKSKKHKSENKGNFSSFRNKSFIPNASKAPVGGGATGAAGAAAAAGTTSKKEAKKSSKVAHEEEEEDEDNGDDDNEDDDQEGEEEGEGGEGEDGGAGSEDEEEED